MLGLYHDRKHLKYEFVLLPILLPLPHPAERESGFCFPVSEEVCDTNSLKNIRTNVIQKNLEGRGGAFSRLIKKLFQTGKNKSMDIARDRDLFLPHLRRYRSQKEKLKWLCEVRCNSPTHIIDEDAGKARNVWTSQQSAQSERMPSQLSSQHYPEGTACVQPEDHAGEQVFLTFFHFHPDNKSRISLN